MNKAVVIFGVGILLAFLAIGGYLASRTFFAGADVASEPQNVVVSRTSPTEGLVTFITVKPVIASIECADDPDGVFTICGAELSPTTDHSLKTSIILDPEKTSYFYIIIGNTRFDNLGQPLEFTVDQTNTPQSSAFPGGLIGVCESSVKYVAEFDVNKDGCIRLNDRDLYGK